MNKAIPPLCRLLGAMSDFNEQLKATHVWFGRGWVKVLQQHNMALMEALRGVLALMLEEDEERRREAEAQAEVKYITVEPEPQDEEWCMDPACYRDAHDHTVRDGCYSD